MTPEQFQQKIRRSASRVKLAMSRTIPIKVGRAAKDLFQDNLRKGGFVNGGLHPWQRSRRIGRAKGAAGSYGTLLSGRNHLFSSIEYTPGDAEVTVSTNVPYARVHNEGLRAGRGRGFTMPKRQFMGESKELTDKVNEVVEMEIEKCLE